MGAIVAIQVLNMKPAEILGMLEEAAGTRMYESKKDAALRTLDKKQVKLDEIDKVGEPQQAMLCLCRGGMMSTRQNQKTQLPGCCSPDSAALPGLGPGLPASCHI